MTSLALVRATDLPATATPEPRRLRALPTRIGERGALTLICFAIYVVVGAVLVFHFDSIRGDALSRVQSAQAVLFSRDPKLAAIGFVWTPLPVLLMLPFMPLQFLWSGLTERGFIVNIQSAMSMAAAVGVLSVILRDWGMRRAPRLLLVILFAAHPMIVYYGSNGMTEALFLLCMLLALRRLTQWVAGRDTAHLALAGVALALAYLTRYEAIAAACAVVVAVTIISFARASGDWRERRLIALCDGVIVALPPLVAFLAWSLISWVVVGSPFEQFTSEYGTTAQLATEAAASGVAGTENPIAFLAGQLFGLEPMLALAIGLAAGVSVWRRSWRFLAVLAVVASVPSAQLLLFLTGNTAEWLRYKLFVVPLMVLLVACTIASGANRTTPAAAIGSRNRIVWPRQLAAFLLIFAVCAPAIPSAAVTMTHADLAVEESAHLPAAFSLMGTTTLNGASLGAFATDRQVAAALDAMKLPPGAILADSAVAFAVILASRHPKQFVVTSDRDFFAAVADPAAFRIQYLLVAQGRTQTDALQRDRPSVYANGAGLGRLVTTFPAAGSGGTTWRLYRVTGS